jgi:tRNA(fMet)-specific endonuclease VapC
MSAITYGELHIGASKSSRKERALEQLEQMVQDIPVLAVDAAAAQAYGEIRAALESQGRLIGNNDLWIGAHAVALKVTLATSKEREFKRIGDLVVENWAK